MVKLFVSSCCLVSLFISMSHGAGLSVEPPFAVLYIVAPSQINITCKYTSPLNGEILWKIGGEDVATKGFTTQIVSTTTGGEKYSEVEAVKEVSTVDDSGEYRCITNDGTSYPIQVVVFTVNVTETEYSRGMGSASLACDPNLPLVDNQAPRYTRKWQRNHKSLTGLKDYATKYEFYDNFTLEILDTERADADAYQCCLLFNQSQEVSITVNYYASPLVKRFEKSKNLIQGDSLELKCAVLGHPIGNITWKKDDIVIEENDRLKFKMYGGLANGVLAIPIIDFDDKGTYMCLATSSKFTSTSNSTIVVRVKDKLAALWPFLGIVAEVIILCIIIFIYEKKRGKNDNTEDEDANVKCGSENAAEANEVRQRNVRT